MKLIRTKERATIQDGNSEYALSGLCKWTDELYFFPQPRYLVRIKYAIDKNS